MPPQIVRSPWAPVLALLLVTLVGGWLNTESARATVLSDATGEVVAPPTLRDVFVGNRHYRVGDDGVYTAPNLPRGAKITIVANGYARTDANASDTEVRLITAIITTQINDADSGVAVPNPKARVGDAQPGNGTPSGTMVIAPAPPRDTDILICAKDYASTTIKSGAANVTVTLKKSPGSDCPALPTPIPAPTAPGQSPQSPAPSPAVSPAPTASPSPAPTASPSPSP